MPVLEDITALVGQQFIQAEFDAPEEGTEGVLKLTIGRHQVVIAMVDIEADVAVEAV